MKSKKKKADGGLLTEYGQPIGMAGNILGNAVGQVGPKNSIGGGIAGGTLKGAGALAGLGPAGLIIGGVGGAIKGGIQAKQAQQQLLADNLGKRADAEAGQMSYAKGGTLSPVSQDAVEVKATNPGQTDSVEIPQAFVDHNEIIDKEDRVFSDEITALSGRTVAKEAKRLEKMKSKNKRFADANSLLDSKLDELFNYQEATKKPSMKKGGKLGKADGGKLDQIQNWLNTDYNLQDKMGAMQPRLATSNQVQAPVQTGLGSGPTTMPVLGGKLGEMANATPEASGTNWSKVGTQVATYAPNVVNAFLQSKLKGPASPTLESGLKLDRVDPSANLSAANRSFTTANKAVKRGVSQSSDLLAATGNLLSKKLTADNAIYGQNQALNAEIQGREAFMNQGVKTRNTERTNQFRQDKVDFSNRKKQLTAENVSNAGTKALIQGKEHNEIDRDKLALEVMSKAYGDSGVIPRNFEDTLDKYFKKKGLKKGGKLGKLYNKK